jgi:hypothetical protein
VRRMNKVVFRLSLKVVIVNTNLVAGLLVFVWVHWRGQRQVELVVFSVLSVLAVSLYTVRSELSLSARSREVSGKRLWLGMVIHKVVVRVGVGDALYLTEELARGEGSGFSIWHQLEASGQLISNKGEHPQRYTLTSQHWPSHQKRLEKFAQLAAKSLRVSLHDCRKLRVGIK